MPNPPSTPSTNRHVYKNKENIVKSSTKKILVVSTPSSRRSAMSSIASDRKIVSPMRQKVLVSPIRSLKITSPMKSSGIPQPSDPKSMLRVKAQRDPNLAVANFTKKSSYNDALNDLSPTKTELGKPQRLFAHPTPRRCEGLLCMSGASANRRRSSDKGGVSISSSLSRSPPRLGANKQEAVLGLKSPARRLGRTVSSKSLRQSPNLASMAASATSSNGSPAIRRKQMGPVKHISSISLSPPRLPPLPSSRSANKKSMADMKVLSERQSNESDNDEPTTEKSAIENGAMQASMSKVACASERHLYAELDEVDTVVLEEALEQLDIENSRSYQSTPSAAAPGHDSDEMPTDKVAAQKAPVPKMEMKSPFNLSTSKVPILPPHMPTPTGKRHIVKARSPRSPQKAVSEHTLRVSSPAFTQPRARISARQPAEPHSSLDAKDSPTKGPPLPLSEVVAFLDIRTSEGSDASAEFAVLLRKLGATVVKQPSRKVTHIIFKHGSPKTPHVARDMNIPCVTILWIVECGKQRSKVDEAAYEVEINSSQARYMLQRRKKSLEPKPLQQGHDGAIERSSVEDNPNAKVAPLQGDIELHPGVAVIVERRKSLTHAPYVSSPLARRIWSAQDRNSDSDQE
ncbi:hypothetical protein POJ06DRAFT_243688 [Lipomyces tetrasporus]|uniref:BRCT domain-containing protein n=1 Tax=Lipomyces tetrasporus TaxID=54092 RepID=A0AAD7R1M2_9ASCO|nr:uncharacterized protein POJ06DRAFT_243688 [Lipomyces tetrasporus]KAJ8104147.1 hypothetical protein POJ06DRAFT_243688 [Lipomyces tetrasporus]